MTDLPTWAEGQPEWEVSPGKKDGEVEIWAGSTISLPREAVEQGWRICAANSSNDRTFAIARRNA